MGRKKTAYPDLPPGMTARKSGRGLKYYFQVEGEKIPLGGVLEPAIAMMSRIRRGISDPAEARFGGLAAMTVEEIATKAISRRTESGVYFLLLADRIVYIGKSLDVWRRIKDHAAKGRAFDSYCWQPCAPAKLDELESFCIRKFRPSQNVALRSNLEPIRTVERISQENQSCNEIKS